MGGLSIYAEAVIGRNPRRSVSDTKTSTISSEIRDLIDTLPDSDSDERAGIINQVVTILFPHFLNWTPKFCRISGDVYGNHREDITSIVAERVLIVLHEFAEDGKHTGVNNWYSYLYGVSRYAALAYFNSSNVTAASGMTALLRRQRHIGRIRAELRSTLGREPESREIVQAANQNMIERRSNPGKQGALVDLSDLDVILPTTDVQNHDRELVADESALLAPVEGRELVTLIIDACTEVSPELGTVAAVWIGGMYADPPTLGVASEVAAALDISTPKASRMLSMARDLAKDLCQRKFGINFPG